MVAGVWDAVPGYPRLPGGAASVDAQQCGAKQMIGSLGLIVLLGVIVLFCGLGSAYAATRLPARRAVLEYCGGVFFIAGLALIGSTFPLP